MEPRAARHTRTGSLSTFGSEKSEEEKDCVSGVYEAASGAAMARGIAGAASDEGRRRLEPGGGIQQEFFYF